LSAAATLTYALGQLPAGYLSDRLGPRRLFFAGLMGWSLLSLSLALIHSFWAAVINQLVAGGLRALLFVPGLVLLRSWFPPQRQATAISLYMVGGFAGNVLLSLAGPLLAQQLGWRFTFMTFSVMGIFAAVAYWALAKEKPRKTAAGNGRIVAVQQGKLLATSFHPELTGDTRIHEFFISLSSCQPAPPDQSSLTKSYSPTP